MPVVRRRRLLRLLLAAASSVWSVKLVRLHLSVARSREHWAVPQDEPGGLLLVALGDSAAQGIGASRPERGYVGLVAQGLRERTGRPVRVVNLSRSGARVEDVLREQLPRLAALSPDLVTVGVGGNDIAAYDRDAFTASVAELVRGLPQGTFVADGPYFMHGRWERDAQAAADTTRALAQQHGLTPVPLHDEQRRQGWSAMATQFAADWFHPNDRGHQVWAQAFFRAIDGSPQLDRLTGPDSAPPRRSG